MLATVLVLPRSFNSLGGVRRGVPSLMISVDAEVESHQFIKARVIIPKHAAEVTGIIKGLVFRHNSIEIDVAINGGSNLRKDSEDVENVIQHELVILILEKK